EQDRTPPAELRLQRSGLVVEAGMDNAAVVTSLVPGELGLLLKERNRGLWLDLQQSAGDRDAQGPPPHHTDSPPHSASYSYGIAPVARLVAGGTTTTDSVGSPCARSV